MNVSPLHNIMIPRKKDFKEPQKKNRDRTVRSKPDKKKEGILLVSYSNAETAAASLFLLHPDR